MADAEQIPAVPTPADRTVALARDLLGDDVLEVVEFRGETTIELSPARLVALCQALRDAPELRYNFLVDITAVDWPDRVPRFDVVYHLLSIPTRAVVRLKVRVGDEGEDKPHMPTVATVWPAANWFEREIYDLFGIIFDGHPDLRRILMPDDWTTYPLRKDYPLTGFVLPDPHWGGQVPFGEPLPPGTGQQTLRTPGGVPGDIEPEQ
jgi:NADH-quinone oxidoreductase subunit C